MKRPESAPRTDVGPGQPAGANIALVINNRFIPDDQGAPYLYGAVQHVVRVGALYDARNSCCHLLTYERHEQLKNPVVVPGTALGRRAVTVRFNFRMQRSSVEAAFVEALQELQLPIEIYSQSVAVADYLPDHIPTVVTNHSPFVGSVYHELGEDLARRAFDWDHPKADFLLVRQAEALRSIAMRRNLVFAEISRLQREYLRDLGFPESQLFELPPVVGASREAAPDFLPPELQRFSRRVRGRIALFPVARFDGFKDLELFIDGAAEALKSGGIDHVVLIGGEPRDSAVSTALSRVDDALQDRFLHLARQRHEVLTRAVFPWIAERGVVVCTSRYDLVPYTILEAVLAGAAVVAPKSRRVGVGDYLPAEWTYDREPRALATALSAERPTVLREAVRAEIAEITSAGNVMSVLDAAFEAARG